MQDVFQVQEQAADVLPLVDNKIANIKKYNATN